jgi:hypothetical protein
VIDAWKIAVDLPVATIAVVLARLQPGAVDALDFANPFIATMYA